MDSEKKIFVIPHFHYDMAWIKTEKHNLKKVYKIFEKVLKIMEKDRDFKYIVDQAFYLEKIKSEKPKLFHQLAERIHEGRIEVVNAGYLMPDLNLISPLIIKKNYDVMNDFAKREFNIKPEVAWMIDCFGHPGIMPKIAKEVDLDYYVFWRGMNKPKANQDFYWIGTDGSTIITHWMKYNYSLFGYTFDNLMKAVCNLDPTTDLVLIPFGCDFCIPYEKFIQQVHKTKGTKFALPSEFFKELEKNKDKLPIVEGEMLSDYSNFKGYYSSRISYKQLYKRTEKEALKRETYDKWKHLLYATSHDFICGTGIDSIYPNLERKLKNSKFIEETESNEKSYKGEFLQGISFELRSEEGDLYNTIPSVKATLPHNAINLKANLVDSVLDLFIQTDFQYPRCILKLIVNTDIKNGKLLHHLCRDLFTERKLNTLHALNDFFEYKDQNNNGIRLYSDDCFNYEVKNNGDIHIILIRSVQILSHGDAGPRIVCSKALELGKHKFRIFISPTGKKRFF